VLERLLVLCADPSAVASSVELILNQRLMRRVCTDCSGKGCASCLQTGYRGRLPVVESFRVTDAMRRRIATGDLDGMAAKPSLADNARALIQAGLTNEAELNRVLG
jgi:type II secretory ATPase GspE/PulE/Tfp pilus assembly ATPase PilB-like protein